MRMTKKLISILLTVCMLMTVVSISFTSFAAVTDAQWNTLIEALKKDTVKNVTYTTNGNAVTINGAHPDVITALDAYVAVYNGSLTTGSDKTRAAAPRVTNAVNKSIQTTLDTKMGTDFTAYNVASVITAFCGNIPVSDNETDNNNKLNAVTITVTVSLDEEYLLGSYESLEELLSASSVTKSYTYSFPNNDASYSVTTTGCGGGTTYHHYLLAAAASKEDGDAVDTAAISDFAAVVQTYGDMYGKTLAELVAMGSGELGTIETAIRTPYDKVSSFINNKFFSEYNTAKLLTDIEDAITISQYTELVAQTAELYAADYSSYTKDELLALYTEFGEKLNAIYATNDVVKNYFGIDETYKTNNNAKLAEFKRAYQLCALREFKADTVDPAYATFVTYNEDDLIKDKEDFVVTDNTITKADVVNAKGLIDGYIKAFDSYDAANVLEVFGQDSLDALDALSEALADLIVIADADIAYAAKIAEFVNTVYAAVDLDDADEALLDQVKAYDGWFTSLKAFEADYVTTYGEETANKIFDGLDKAMNDKLTEKYAVLEARMKAQVDVAWLLLDEAKVAYGGEVTIVSIETFGKLYNAVGALNRDLAAFLKTTENYDLDATIEAEYDELCEVVFDDYNEFLESGGYDKYVTTTYADITRTVADGEKIRDKDYTVDDEKLEAIIDLIDEALNSKEIKTLLAEEGEEEGDIAAKLHDALGGAIYTDSLLNTITGALYKLVAEELQKVWSGMVPEQTSFDVGVTLNADLRGLDPLHSIANKLGLRLFPKYLAENVRAAGYTEAADKLAQAVSESVYTPEDEANGIEESVVTAWSDDVLYDEDGNLDLYWGITDKDSFVDAAKAALSGIEPLLLALLANKSFDSGMIQNLGSFTGSAKVIFTITINAKVQMDLKAAGCSGYNDVIIPILEALGVPAEFIPDGNTFTSIGDILVKGLIEPVGKVLDMVGEAPVDFVTKALPNLAYALQAGRVIPLLKTLSTEISFVGGLYDYGLLGWLAGYLTGDLGTILTPDLLDVDPNDLYINVGEMIDFDDLGIDISSLNGLLGMVGGLLGEGLTLPAMDGGVLASLGTLTQIPTKRDHKTYAWGDDDKAAYIEANRADVLLFLFDYVIEALKAQPTIIEDIVNAVQASKAEEEAATAAEAGEEYIAPEPFVMPEEVTAILNNVLNGYDKAENKFDALAALAELIFPVEYTTTADELVYDSTALDPDYMITDLHTGETKVVFDSDVEYTEWWTEEKAQYVADNLQTFIDNIIMMFGVKIGDVKVESLSETVTELVNTLYAPETVNELAATLAGLLDGLEIEDDLKTLLMGIIADNLGDISVWDGYEADFEAGDKDGFVAAMTEVLAPVEKVLQFILTDENLTVSLNGADGKFQVIELPGYMGYTYGLIPLFEALGAEDVMDTDAFAADKDNIIANLLNTLTGIVDTVAADPYAAIENILPNLLYFVESDGVQVAVDNLLYAVNQALEVIAPIYKVNLNELLPFDIRFAGIDPVAFLFTELEAMAYEATGIDFNFDFTAAELLNDLTFGEMLTYTSATGKEAYKVAPGALTADMVTQVLRFLLEEAMFSDNMSSLINWARVTYELPDEIYYPLYAFFYGLFTMKDTHIDYALGIVYYAFFGANTAVEAVADYYQYMRYDWQAIAEQLKDEDMTDLEKAAYIFKEIYNTTGMTILDSLYEQGKSPISSGFFAKIKEMLRAYIELFKTIFSGFSALVK